jgi:predicted peptidase
MKDGSAVNKSPLKMFISAMALFFILSCKKETAVVSIPGPDPVPVPAPVSQPTPASPYTLTPKPVSISAHCNGFYEYLPEGYSTDPANTKYPLMIVFHGGSDTGEDSSALSKVLRNGPLKLAKDGTLPKSFSLHGQTYKFIILAPQYTSSGSTYPNEIDELIEYAKQNYKVDPSRIYLTGYSFGGGLCWSYVGASGSYASKIAAMVPIAAYINEEREEFKVNTTRAQNITSTNLPIWSTHNSGDRTCPLTWVVNAYAILNKTFPLPNPLPKLTIFSSDTHGGWTQTYNPLFKENEMNVYEWMLQYHR